MDLYASKDYVVRYPSKPTTCYATQSLYFVIVGQKTHQLNTIAYRASVERVPHRPALGYRPNGKDGQPKLYVYYTYTEAAKEVEKLAAALVKLGLERGGRVGVFGPNSCEWMFAMQACNRQAFVCVPLYATLGEDAIEYEVWAGCLVSCLPAWLFV